MVEITTKARKELQAVGERFEEFGKALPSAVDSILDDDSLSDEDSWAQIVTMMDKHVEPDLKETCQAFLQAKRLTQEAHASFTQDTVEEAMAKLEERYGPNSTPPPPPKTKDQEEASEDEEDEDEEDEENDLLTVFA